MKKLILSVHTLFASLIVVFGMSFSSVSQSTPIVGMDVVFKFTGLCTDCASAASVSEYPVTGLLSLTDFVPQATLDRDNFVSFSYGGSNLIDPFEIFKSDIDILDGALNADGTLFSPYLAFWEWDLPDCQYCYFVVESSGDWSLEEDDYGINGRFSRVPEPTTILLLGLGLAGILYQSRKHKELI
jgi:PEP-CTERM motif-containing protein